MVKKKTRYVNVYTARGRPAPLSHQFPAWLLSLLMDGASGLLTRFEVLTEALGELFGAQAALLPTDQLCQHRCRLPFTAVAQHSVSVELKTAQNNSIITSRCTSPLFLTVYLLPPEHITTIEQAIACTHHDVQCHGGIMVNLLCFLNHGYRCLGRAVCCQTSKQTRYAINLEYVNIFMLTLIVLRFSPTILTIKEIGVQ